jgi:hypothetical protein
MSLSSNKPSAPGLAHDHQYATGDLLGERPQPSAEACLELLRAYEPIVKFTGGELFFRGLAPLEEYDAGSNGPPLDPPAVGTAS